MTSSTAPEATTSRDFSTIGVVGLGTMGAGIAEVFARNGFAVVGVEVNDESLERGRQHLLHSTSRAVARGKLSEEDQQALVDRVTFTTSMKDLADADFVVEAVVESIEVKKAIFRDLEAIVPPEAILATNTSSLSVTEISTANAAPGSGDRGPLLQPGPGAELRGDHPHRGHRARRARRREGAGRAARQDRSCAATGPASSPTPCCSGT